MGQHPAPTDGDGAVEVFSRVGKGLPRRAKVWADSASWVGALLTWIKENGRRVLEVVAKRPGQKTSEVQTWRWVVERTFGWFGRSRRLSKDYEHNPKSRETWISVARTHRMSRRSLPKKNRDDDLLRRPRKRRKT
jgi:putative transposase